MEFGFNVSVRYTLEEILRLGDTFLANGDFSAIEATCYEHMAGYDSGPYTAVLSTLMEKYHPKLFAHILNFNIAEEDAVLRNAILAEIENSILYLKALGGMGVIIHSGSRGGKHLPGFNRAGKPDSGEDSVRRCWELSVDIMQKACDIAAKFGITVYTENLSTHYLTTTAEELLQYLQDVDRKNCKVVFDVGHCYHSGLNVPDEVRKLGQVLEHLHIHDNHGVKDEHLPLGGGTLNVEAFAGALAEIDYKGIYMFELLHPGPFESLGRSYRIMKTHAEQAAAGIR
jgi:sugar phosphate isomerase/epimerase